MVLSTSGTPEERLDAIGPSMLSWCLQMFELFQWKLKVLEFCIFMNCFQIPAPAPGGHLQEPRRTLSFYIFHWQLWIMIDSLMINSLPMAWSWKFMIIKCLLTWRISSWYNCWWTIAIVLDSGGLRRLILLQCSLPALSPSQACDPRPAIKLHVPGDWPNMLSRCPKFEWSYVEFVYVWTKISVDRLKSL